MQHHPRSAPQYLDKKVMDDLSELRRGRSPLEINFEAQRDEESWMPAHELLRQVKAKSLSVKISKNDPNTARVNWQLADGEFLTVEIPAMFWNALSFKRNEQLKKRRFSRVGVV